MPWVVFVLLAVVCLGLIGFACACFGDRPGLALERSLDGPAVPGLIELWPWLLALLAPAVVLFVRGVALQARASPAQLQRFLL